MRRILQEKWTACDISGLDQSAQFLTQPGQDARLDDVDGVLGLAAPPGDLGRGQVFEDEQAEHLPDVRLEVVLDDAQHAADELLVVFLLPLPAQVAGG